MATSAVSPSGRCFTRSSPRTGRASSRWPASDRAALLAEIGALLERKELSIRSEDGQLVENADQLRELSASFLDEQLARLPRMPALMRPVAAAP